MINTQYHSNHLQWALFNHICTSSSAIWSLFSLSISLSHIQSCDHPCCIQKIINFFATINSVQVGVQNTGLIPRPAFIMFVICGMKFTQQWMLRGLGKGWLGHRLYSSWHTVRWAFSVRIDVLAPNFMIHLAHRLYAQLLVMAMTLAVM